MMRREEVAQGHQYSDERERERYGLDCKVKERNLGLLAVRPLWLWNQCTKGENFVTVPTPRRRGDGDGDAREQHHLLPHAFSMPSTRYARMCISYTCCAFWGPLTALFSSILSPTLKKKAAAAEKTEWHGHCAPPSFLHRHPSDHNEPAHPIYITHRCGRESCCRYRRAECDAWRERRCRMNLYLRRTWASRSLRRTRREQGEYLSSSTSVKATERPPPLASPSLSFNCASLRWVWHQWFPIPMPCAVCELWRYT